jgi:hypothetical protein
MVTQDTPHDAAGSSARVYSFPENRVASATWDAGGNADVQWKGAAVRASTNAQPCDTAEAAEPDDAPTPFSGKLNADDFYAYMPKAGAFIYAPTRDIWPTTSVDAQVPWIPDTTGKDRPPGEWLLKHRAVHQWTWAPGQPELIRGKIVDAGAGFIERPGALIFNQYRPPVLVPRPGNVDPWINLIERVFPEDVEPILDWLAHRVQRPGEKLNHAMVLGGEQRIGKDTILKPVRHAVGPSNFRDCAPSDVLGTWTDFTKAVILRINEARDIGREFDRFKFYDHCKTLIAEPPETLRCNEKHIPQYYIPNLVGVVITTNHKTDGLYLPAGDGRHYVAWSPLTMNPFPEKYWIDLHHWYEREGYAVVAHYLKTRNLRHFNPKAPPPRTDAFWAMADDYRAPESAEMDDALDRLGRPDIVTIARIVAVADASFTEWLTSRENARIIPRRLDECGYVQVRNPDAIDGRWRLQSGRKPVYGRKDKPPAQLLTAARNLASQ